MGNLRLLALKRTARTAVYQWHAMAGERGDPGVRPLEGVVFYAADDDFLRLLVAGFAVELEQTEIVAVRALLCRCGQVFGSGCFCVLLSHE